MKERLSAVLVAALLSLMFLVSCAGDELTQMKKAHTYYLDSVESSIKDSELRAEFSAYADEYKAEVKDTDDIEDVEDSLSDAVFLSFFYLGDENKLYSIISSTVKKYPKTYEFFSEL